MSEFKVGTNFDFSLLDIFNELNKKSKKNKITEVYGSDRQHSKLAARPGFRLPDISSEYLENYVSKAKEQGIMFNYTMNSFIPYGSKKEINANKDSIIEFTKYLQSIGVHRVTIANPIMLELIRGAGINIEVEISTCAHIDTITQIKYYHEKYGVNKICGNLLKNRDFNFLEKAAKYCNDNNIIYELMANEFCGVGGDNYATHCIYRDSCYVCHATNETLDDANLLSEYPMRLCTASRNENPANWLKLRFIRPEDIHYYEDIGINHFKITGRTGSTNYIQKVMSAYLFEQYNGNLLGLWKPLESIKDESLEQIQSFNISNEKLNGFIEMWAKNRHNCDLEVCGDTCKYCDKFYNNIKGE